ncbi:MAG: hypothetical protein M3Y39_18185 [Chloroflexota bacterium]|nr:hypothetical protein [Chloroflexota bacterium]
MSQGGLAQVPGFPGVMSITFDPTTNIDSGGTRTYTNADGTLANGYEIFQNNTPNTFGKANGLGSLVPFCQSAPIELGDRVWFDSNGNGIQDANEPGIANVMVHLYAADGTTLLQTTTTDANGNYAFTISPYTSYVIKLDKAADYASNGPLHAYQLTTPNKDSSTHSTDSKGVLPAPAQPLGNGNYPQITVGNHNPGQNDYNQDFGFSAFPDLSITKTHAGSGAFMIGQTASYTLQVTANPAAGPVVTGQPITVTDTIPSGLSNVTANGGSSWNISGSSTITATYTGSYPVLPGTNLAPITISGTLTNAAAPALANSATVSTPTDGNVSNNTASDTLQVCGPDLTIVKTHQGGSTFKVGQTITYNLQVSNAATGGPIFNGEPVTVTDALPRGIDAVQAHGTGWHIKLTTTRVNTTVVATYAGSYPIASGAQFPVIIVTGKLTNAATGSLTNSASVATPLDRHGGNNTDNNHIVVERQPDLSVSMNHNAVPCAKVKRQVTYQVQVHVMPDSGPIEHNVPITVVDAVPNGLQSIVARGSGWQVRFAPGRGTTQVIAIYRRNADLNANTTLPPLLINATVSNYSDRPLLSMARVDVAGDSNPANNSARDLLSVCHRPPALPPTGSNPDTLKGLVPFRKFRLR